jgi:hypothetical protein
MSEESELKPRSIEEIANAYNIDPGSITTEERNRLVTYQIEIEHKSSIRESGRQQAHYPAKYPQPPKPTRPESK